MKWQEGKTSLYVSDLETSVTDSELFNAFSYASPVHSVRVCRDCDDPTKSLGYGYVTFDYPHDATRALEMMNFTALKGKDIRVMYYVHNPVTVLNPRLRKRAAGNIFIKNLEKTIDHRALYETLCCFGSILRFKVAINVFGESKGFGFVQYDREESAQSAIRNLNGMLLNDEQVYVGPFLQRDTLKEKVMFTDIYVKNLSKSLTDEELNTIFREFGPTTNCVIMRDGLQGKSKGYGIVTFENPEDAERAVEALNGKKFEDKKWFVMISRKKYQWKSQVKRGLKHAIHRSQGSDFLCVKKLDKRVTDEMLKDFFSSYGTITSCKVMRDTSGVSKGSGFVSFSKPDEALRAMLGENLYPMVKQLAPKFAAKITGMILVMDQTQVLHLLESPDALESKVAEAMEIMKTVNKQKHQQVGCVSESPVKHSVFDHKATKSTNNSKPFSSTSFRSPKLSSISTRERSDVLLTNRFASLKDSGDDEDGLNIESD